MRRLHAQLARRIRVQQVVAQHAVLHHHRAPRRQSLAIERRSSKAARPGRQQHQVVVHNRDGRSCNGFAQLPGQKRCPAPDRISARRLKHRPDQRARRLRRKNNRHPLRRHAPRAQPPQGSPCCLSPYRFRVFKVREAARARPPAVALHLPIRIHSQRRSRHARISWCDSCPQTRASWPAPCAPSTASKLPPSELLMRASALSAAASARRAHSIRSGPGSE